SLSTKPASSRDEQHPWSGSVQVPRQEFRPRETNSCSAPALGADSAPATAIVSAGAHARVRPSRASVPCVRWGCRGSVHGGIFGGRDTLVPFFVTDPTGSWVWFTKTRGTTWFQVRG